MSVATYEFDTLVLHGNTKVRNQVDLASETRPNRYGLRAAGTLCRASESCRHAALLLRIEGEVAPTIDSKPFIKSGFLFGF